MLLRCSMTSAFAATGAAALTIAAAVVGAAGFAANLRDRVIAATEGANLLVGVLCLGAVTASVVAARLGAPLGRTTLSFRLTAVVAAVALILALAAVWNYLTIHISIPSNLNETSGITWDTYGLPSGYRAAGVLRALAAAALLLPTLLLAWPHLRLARSEPEGADDSGAE